MKPTFLKSRSFNEPLHNFTDEKLKPFKAVLDEKQGLEDIFSILKEKVYSLFMTEFQEKISLILVERADDFIEMLSKRVERLIEDNYKVDIDDYEEVSQLIKKTAEAIKKDRFMINYKMLSSNLAIYENKIFPARRSLSKNIEILPFLKKFRRHCKETTEALHTCGDKMIEIYEDSESKENSDYAIEKGARTVSHLLCVRCKSVYLPDCIHLYCTHCKTDYFSSLEQEESKYQPATWTKYHCGAIINDRMRCIKCKDIFYLNCENGLLECLKCNLTLPAMSIHWTCMICKGEFNSEAKIYNSLEFKAIKTAIKEAIIQRNIAKPQAVPCCSDLEINSTHFYHKKECTGRLYFGELENKKIVVCSQCKTMNFYDKYIWTCPSCFKRFRVKEAEEKTENPSQHSKGEKYEPLQTIQSGRESEALDSNIKCLQKRKNSQMIVVDNSSPSVNNRISNNSNSSSRNSSSNLKQRHSAASNISNAELKVRPFVPRSDSKYMVSPQLQRMQSIPQNESVNINLNINIRKSLMSSFNNSLSRENIPEEQEENNRDRVSNVADIETISQPNRNSTSNPVNVNLINIINMNKSPLKSPLKSPFAKLKPPPVSRLILNKEYNITKIIDEEEAPKVEETQGSKFSIDDYDVVSSIGEGSFGKIYKVQNKKTKKFFGLKKIIAHSEKEVEEFKKEYEIMNWITTNKNCQDNILNIMGVSVKALDSTTFAVYVLMELAESDWEKEINIRAKAKNYYSESELFSIVKGVITTLANMQKENISHRDIKPQNILIFHAESDKNKTNNIYKLADFGEAKDFSSGQANNTLRGTELYMSPLLFTSLRMQVGEKESKIKHDAFKSDVFSVGYCLLFAASLTFRSLYEIRELSDMKKVATCVNRYLSPRYSNKFINLVLTMLRLDESKRPDFLELVKYLDN